MHIILRLDNHAAAPNQARPASAPVDVHDRMHSGVGTDATDHPGKRALSVSTLTSVLPILHILPDNTMLDQVLHPPSTRTLPRPDEPTLSTLLESLQFGLQELPRHILQRLIPPPHIDIILTLATIGPARRNSDCAAIWVCADVCRGAELSH
jgi:hypothetical protein